MKRKQKSEKMQMKKDLMVVQRYNANVVLVIGLLQKKYTPTDGKLEILTGGGVDTIAQKIRA